MKKKRSLMALLLVCAVLSSMICLPTAATESSDGTVTKVYGQNFEDLTTGMNSKGYADVTYSGSEVYGSHEEAGRSKIATGVTKEYVGGNVQRHYLQKNTGAVYFPMSGMTYVDAETAYTNEGASADLYVDFDFYTDSSVEQNKECFILGDSGVMGKTTPQAMGEYAYVNVAAVPVDAASGKIRIATAYDSDYTYQDVSNATFSIKAWNHLTIVVHATDDSAAKGTYDVYLNGSKIVDGQALMSNNSANAAREAIRVFAVAASGDKGTSVFCDMDNLYAYKTKNIGIANYGKMLQTIADARETLEAAKEGEMITESEYTGYYAVTTACMNTYLAAQGQGKSESYFADSYDSLNEMLANIGYYVVSGVSYTDENKTALSSISLKKIFDYTGNAKIVVALYNSDGMVSAQTADAAEGTVTLEPMALDGCTAIKIFIWDLNNHISSLTEGVYRIAL